MLVTVNTAGRAIKVEGDPYHPATDGGKPNAEIFRLIAARMGLTDACLQEDDMTIAKQAFHWDHAHTRDMAWETLQTQGWQKLAVADAPFAPPHRGVVNLLPANWRHWA